MRFSNQNIYNFVYLMHATYATHLILISLTTVRILCTEYRLCYTNIMSDVVNYFSYI